MPEMLRSPNIKVSTVAQPERTISSAVDSVALVEVATLAIPANASVTPNVSDPDVDIVELEVPERLIKPATTVSVLEVLVAMLIVPASASVVPSVKEPCVVVSM